MQLNQRNAETDLQKNQRDIDETLRAGRQDAPAWQIDQRNIDARQRNIGGINEIYQLRQIDQRNTVVILRTIQQNAVIILDLMKIDLESLSIKLRNNRFIIEFKIRGMLHPSENIRKSLNKK
jgi:hypothetical protein